MFKNIYDDKYSKKVFWEFDSIIMQNQNDILPLFCKLKRPSYPVSENQEDVASRMARATKFGPC